MADPLTAIRTRNVPQSEQSDPRQVENHAGGYAFEVEWRQRLTRFLVLGSMGGTYYAAERDHTADNAEAVRRIIAEHGSEAVQVILDVSHAGRAPKQQPTMFALALAASSDDVETRRAALSILPNVCRIGTHLFLFARYVEQFRGWGRALRRAVADWYVDKPVDDLAYQMVKYGQREGWSHRDMLRLAHPTADDVAMDDLFAWVTGKPVDGTLPAVVVGAQEISTVTDPAVAAQLVAEYGLPWEAVPSELLNEPAVWEALLPKLGVGAMLRQLPRLTRLGLLNSGEWRTLVTTRLSDTDTLTRARLHPLTVLNGLFGYRKGQARSGGEFRPVPQVIDALDAGFYASFGSVTPIGKPVMLALDVSGSMSFDTIAGTALTPREASAALALVTASTEPDYEIVGFTGDGYTRASTALTPLPISPRQRLDDVIRTVSDVPFGATDCALPFIDAMTRQIPVDLFAVYTDNETWAGQVHPHTALQNYRDRMSRPDARSVVVGMTATNFTIADPSDPRMLDVVGFDTATPELISAFGRGEL